jgi:hypothetical protein
MLLLAINLVGAILVIASYVYFLPRLSEGKAWAGISGYGMTVYTVSILLAAVAYIVYLSQVLVAKETKNGIAIGIAMALFLLSAALWAPSMYYLPNHRYVTVACLTATSAGVIGLFCTSSSRSPLQTVCLAYLLSHVFVLDNVNWSSRYLRGN